MATQFAVDLVFKSQGLNKLNNATRKLQGIDGASKKAQASLKGAENNVRGLDRAAGKAATGGIKKLEQGLAGLVAGYASVTAVAALAGNAINTAINREESIRRLRLLSEGYGEFNRLQQAAAEAANKFGLGQTETNQALADVYARLKPVGASLEEIVSIYSGFNTAARNSGASAVEASNAFRQLSQALGSGALRGDEFNSIAEQVPGILTAIAKETGVAQGQLRKFAAEGGITSDIVLRALKRIEKEGAEQLKESLEGPRQKLKELEKKTEDLNVAIGKLGLPAVLAVVDDIGGKIGEWATAVDNLAAAFSGLDGILGPVLSKLIQINDIIANINPLGFLIDGLPKGINSILGGGKKNGTTKPTTKPTTSPSPGLRPPTPTPTPTPASTRRGGSGGGRAPRESMIPALTRELALSNALLENQRQSLQAQFDGNKAAVQRLAYDRISIELAGKEAKIAAEKIPEGEKALKRVIAQNEAITQQVELQFQGLETEKQRKEQLAQTLQPIEDEIALLQGRLDGNQQEIQDLIDIRELKKQIIALDGDPSRAEALIKQRNEMKEQVKVMEEIEARSKEIASGIAGEMTGALRSIIDGTKQVDEAFADMLKGIADKFMDMAMQILQDALTKQLMQLFSGLLGGGGGGSVGGGAFSIGQAAGFGGFFADGGTLGAGKWGIAGEAGPELITGPARIHPAGEGGAVNSVVNISISDSGTSVDAKNAGKIGRMIESSTMAILTRERRPGGLLTR